MDELHLEISRETSWQHKKIWWRHEYQETQGNLSHIHALLWTDDDLETTDGWEAATECIHGDLRKLIRVDKLHCYWKKEYPNAWMILTKNCKWNPIYYCIHATKGV